MKRSMAVLLLGAVLGMGCAGPGPSEPNGRPMMDETFVQKATQGGMTEVRLAELAQIRAINPEVRAFAEQMSQDHGKTNDQLKSLARQEGIKVPEQLAPEQRQLTERLAAMSGSEFDRAYMDQQVQAHQQTVELFRQEANQGESQALQSFADNKLPILQGHLDKAQSIREQLSVTASAR